MTRSSLLIAQKCSIIQVQGFVKARNKLTAFLWILALIVSMSFMITQTGRLFKGFFSGNKQTMVKLKSSELPFPAVTFCNLNPFKKNEAEKVPILATIMKVAQSVGSKDFNDRKKRQSLADCEEAGSRIRRNGCVIFALANMELSFGFLYVNEKKVFYGRYESPDPIFALWKFVDAGSSCEFVVKSFANSLALTYSNQNGSAKLSLEQMRGGEDQIFVVVQAMDGYGKAGYVLIPKRNKSLSIRLTVEKEPIVSFEYMDSEQKPGNVWKLIDMEQSAKQELETAGQCSKKEFTKPSLTNSIPKMNIQNYAGSYSVQDIEHLLGFSLDDGYVWKLSSLNDLIPYSISSLSREQRRVLGYQLFEMIIECQFGQKACSSSDVQLWQDLTSGNCMTFFGGFNRVRNSTKFVDKAGKENGFKIVLNVSQDTYLETSLSAGFRFSVNDPDDLILPDCDGRILSPGFSIDRTMNRLNWPRGSCEPNSDEKKPKLELCLRYCYQRKIISYCNCADPKYPIPPDLEDEFGYCGVKKSDPEIWGSYIFFVKKLSTPGNCLVQIVSLLSLFENDCDCKDRCHSKYYIYTTSMAKTLEKSGNSAKNTINVYVYYQSMLHMVYEESTPYKMANLLGDIGGLSGIWLGASFFSIFEILIVIILFGRC